MKRNYVINKGNIEIMLDFGDPNKEDYAVMVKSEVKDGKVKVISTTTLGKSKRWDEDAIKLHLICLSEEYDTEK